MKTYIAQWGNSLAIRIPAPLAKKLHLLKNTPINLESTNDSLIVCKQENDIESLVQQITDENLHSEQDFGSPQGKEVW